MRGSFCTNLVYSSTPKSSSLHAPAFCAHVAEMKSVKRTRDWAQPMVSSLGRFRDNNGFCRDCPTNANGYPSFTVSKGDARASLLLHRVVHILFNDPTLSKFCKGMTVDHIDRNVGNSHHCNLRWATKKEQYANSSAVLNFGDDSQLVHRQRIRAVAPDGCVYDISSLSELAEVTGMTVSGNLKLVLRHQGWIVNPQADEDLEGEVWRSHPIGVQVSNLGRYSKDGLNKVSCSSTGSGGYSRPVKIHSKNYIYGRLVLEAFGIPRPTDQHTVDHINRDRRDDRLENLRWATRTQQRENQARPSRRLRRPFVTRKVGSITELHMQTIDEAVAQTGCNEQGIRNVLNPSSRARTVPGFHGARYEFFLDEDFSQENLPGEEWKPVEAVD